MNTSSVISMFGGIRPLARLLGYPVSTVQNWEHRDRIPDRHFHALTKAANKVGVDLPAEELIKLSKPKRIRKL